MINKAAESEIPVEEVVIGMAHRGRLNVLCNIVGKTYEQIFSAFEAKTIPGSELRFRRREIPPGLFLAITTANGKTVYVKLLPNPSHLEAVNPVVEGFCRAKLDILYGSMYDRILPILIHGDAAVAGQGIVYEVTQMMDAQGISHRGYRAPGDQQPDRFHHRLGGRPLQHLLHQLGRSGAGAGISRQRRRPGGSGVCGGTGHRIPPRCSIPTCSSTWSVTAATATTKATNRVSPSRPCGS